EAGVEREWTGVQVPPQRIEFGGLRDQSTPGQLVENVLTHGATSLRSAVRDRPLPVPIGSLASSLTEPLSLTRNRISQRGGPMTTRRLPPLRYTLTAGEPSTQNRQGTSIAVATPTLGPLRSFSAGTGSPASRRSGEAGSVRSAPLSSRSRPSTAASRAG